MAMKKTADKQRKNSEKKPRGRPWTKGVSGNPGGRPPSKKYLSEALREWLAHASNDDPERTNADQLAAAVGQSALNGNVQAVIFIGDRTEGKSRQQIDLSIDDRRRRLIENAIVALMADCAIDRIEAIENLARIYPEIREWIN